MVLTVCLAGLLFYFAFYTHQAQILIKVLDSVSQEAKMESKVGGYKIVAILHPSGEQRAVILLIIITNQLHSEVKNQMGKITTTSC